MIRALFTKTGDAVWISHLDLMRVLQRAFRRGGMMLKHSQGFTPHPHLSIAMPLSVGVASDYELMDFDLAEEDLTPIDAICEKLNASLPSGVRVLSCYENGRKLKELQYLKAELTLEYDNGVPDSVTERLQKLYERTELPVEKHGKNGPTETDIAPMLREVIAAQSDANTILLTCTVSAQNPTLNPLLLIEAIRRYLPEDLPDFFKCRRLCLYDAQMEIFR